MTTQYSPILKLALPVQGELSGTWGDVVNDNITSMVEQAIAGRAVINTWTTNSHTLTSANGTTSESRCAMLELTDTGTALTGAGTVVCPTASKIYIVKNAAGQNITVQTSGGTGILVPNGRTTFLFCDGTNVVEALTHTTSLQLGTSTTVTAVLDEDNMASDSATSLATQQSIKAYVDAQVGANNELSEVLANGNTTGSNNIIVDNGQKITTNTIDETTAGSGVTIDSVLLKDDVVNATDVETGSISANDGTTAATIANSTGVITVPSAVLTTADINGGTADGVVIGGSTPAAATVTTATANTSLTIAGTTTVTSILDEDNMASDDPAGLATQQSIKAYVDAQVGTVDTLAEVLANGNTTGGTDIAVSAGDDITFTTTSKAIFDDGAGGSLQIYHDGSNSYVEETGAGQLLLRGAAQVKIESSANDDIMVRANSGASVDLFYAGAAKLATTSTGVDVTGSISADGLTVDGDANFSGAAVNFDLDETDTTDLNTRFRQSAGQLFVQTINDAKAVGTNRLNINHTTGDITFYDGGTASFVYDASAGTTFNEAGSDRDFRVESDSNANMLFVDAGNNTVGIGDGAPTEAGLVIASIGTDANTSARLALKSTETSVDTFLRFGRFGTGDDASFTIANNYYRTSSGYVADDTSYGPTSIYFGDGEMSFGTVLGAAAPLQRMIIKGSEIVINEQSYNQDFRVESDADTHMLFVDAAENAIGFGDSAPRDGSWGTASSSRQVSIQGSSYGVLHLKSTAGTSTRWAMGAGDSGRLYAAYDDINARHNLTYYGAGAVFNPDGNSDIDFQVESDNNTHMLFVDAGADHVNIGTSADYGSTLNVFTTGTDALEIVSDNGNANAGPYLDITRKSGSPADGDLTGAIRFLANSDAAETTVGSISTRFDDVSNASEDSSMFFKIRQAGAQPNVLIFDPSETVVNEDSYDRDFRVESDSNAHFLFVDAGNERLGINNSAPSTLVDVQRNSATGFSNTSDQRAQSALTIRNGSEASGRFVGMNLIAGGGAQSDWSINNVWQSNYVGKLAFKTRTGANSTDWRQLFAMTAGSEAVFNEDSTNFDFRVESDNNANMFVIDAANDCVNIGTSSSIASQDATLNVNGFGIKSFSVNSNTLTDTGISVNQEGSGMACMVLASNHYSTGAATRAAQYFLQFYYNGNTAPAVVQVAGTTGLVTFGMSANNTLTIQMPAGGNHISFLMSG